MLGMNILFLALDIDLRSKTGDSIHVRELATSLAKLGNNVFLITAHTDNGSDLDWAEKNPNLHLFFNKTGQTFRTLSTLIHCRKIAKQNQVHIIYERRNSPKIGFALSKLRRIPLVIEINALIEEEIALIAKRRERTTPMRPLKRAFRRRFFKHTKTIVTVTHSIKDEIQRNYDISDERIVVVPNGANTNLFKPMDQDVCREDIGLDNNEKYICFTGNLAPWQGVRYMIDAMPLIVGEMPVVKFLVVGGGYQKKALQVRAKELNVEKQVIFTGWTDYENVPKYLNASDICVAPLTIGREKSGSSAIKIYEYLACGKPVIAFDVPNIGFLESDGCGIIVSRDDVPALADATLKLLRDPLLRTRMGETGRSIVVEKYSWTNTAKRVTELLENAI